MWLINKGSMKEKNAREEQGRKKTTEQHMKFIKRKTSYFSVIPR